MHIAYDVPDWTKGFYQDQAPVRKCARPWRMAHEKKSDVAVLLCHGYTGYPGELIRPGIDLYDAGFDCYAIRYPGHGTSQRDFLKSDRRDWLGTAEAAYEDLQGRYRNVYLAGHSMGGIITVILAARHPQVKRIALIAPALEMIALQSRWKRIQLAFSQLCFPDAVRVPWKRDPAYHFLYEGDPDDDAYLGAEYWQYMFVRKVWQLNALAKQARSLLPSVKADALSLSGGLDVAVCERSSVMVEQKPLGVNKHIHLPNATHLIPYDKDQASQDAGMRAIVDWFTR